MARQSHFKFGCLNVLVLSGTSLWGDAIESQLDLEQGIAALYAAEENDQVVIHLNCDGGNADVGDSFLYAMGKCKAPIHCIVTGRAASLATFILLEADSYEISPFATILCHSASYGSVGKMADTLQHSAITPSDFPLPDGPSTKIKSF